MINIIINPIQWCRDLIKSTVSSTLYPAVSSYSFGGIQIQSINFTQWNGPMLFKCWINKVIFLSMLLWINVSKHYHCIHCCRNSVFQMGNPVLVPLTPPLFFVFACMHVSFLSLLPDAWAWISIVCLACGSRCYRRCCVRCGRRYPSFILSSFLTRLGRLSVLISWGL